MCRDERCRGKSNFIGSLKFLKSLVDANSQVQSVRAYVNAISAITEKNPVQRFEITFLSVSGQIYRYSLAIDRSGIMSEALYKQSKRRAAFSCLFAIERNTDRKYGKKDGKAGELEAALKNSNNSYGL